MRGVLAGVIAVAALCVAAVSNTAARAEQPAAPTWTAQSSPFRLSFNDAAGHALTAEVNDGAGPGGRLSYELSGGARHTVTNLTAQHAVAGGTAYDVATDEPGRTATVTVTRVADGIRVSWQLRPSTGVVRVYEAFSSALDDHFLGSGVRALYVDLAHRVVPLKVHFTPAYFLGQCNQTSTPAPYFASSAGWGVHLRHTDIGRLAFPGAIDVPDPPQCFAPGAACPVRSGAADRVQVCLSANRLEYDLLPGAPIDVASAYARGIGTPDVAPLAQYGLVKWRESVTGAAEVFDDIDQLQQRSIPVTSVLVDNPWETDGAANSNTGSACVGALSFEPSQFPDPGGMIRAVHQRGVRFMLWVAPFYLGGDCPNPGYPSGSVVHGVAQADAVPPPFGTFLGSSPNDLDLTRQATRDAYIARLANVFSLGVDGVKADRGDETDFEASTFAGGPGTALHNQVPVLYAQAVRDALRVARQRRGEPVEDSTMMLRAGGPGSARATVGMWGGDQEMTVDGLRLAVRMGQTAGAAGFAAWGSDIGGYSGPVVDLVLGQTPLPALEDVLPSEALFLRWAQFGAFTPVMEVGGRGQQQEFWSNYSAGAVDVFRDFALLHYALIPHFDDLARAAHATGAPVLRPLALQYPGDPAAWLADQEFLLGHDVLVAPVTAPTLEATDPVGATVVPVVVPSGTWVDLFSAARATGPTTVTRATPVDEVPAYLRAGAAIAFNGRQPAMWSTPWPVAALDMKERAGWLWAPDATSATSATSASAGVFHGAVAGGAWNLALDSPRRETQVIAMGDGVPQSVVVNGTALPRFGDAHALMAAASGWAPTDASIGRVVIKFTVPPVVADTALPATGGDITGLWPALAAAMVAVVRRLGFGRLPHKLVAS